MCRVSVPCLSLWERWPAQRGRRGQTMTIPALSVTCGDSSPKGESQGSVPRYIGAYRGGVRPSAPTTVYRTCALSLPCHSESVTDVTGSGIQPPSPPSAGRRREAPEGEDMPRQRRGIRGDGHRPLRTAYRNPMRHIRAGRPVRPYTAYRTRTLSSSCHSEPVLTLAWESVPVSCQPAAKGRLLAASRQRRG